MRKWRFVKEDLEDDTGNWDLECNPYVHAYYIDSKCLKYISPIMYQVKKILAH